MTPQSQAQLAMKRIEMAQETEAAKEMSRRIKTTRFMSQTEKEWQSREAWWNENYPLNPLYSMKML